jgi:hypothetical protein
MAVGMTIALATVIKYDDIYVFRIENSQAAIEPSYDGRARSARRFNASARRRLSPRVEPYFGLSSPRSFAGRWTSIPLLIKEARMPEFHSEPFVCLAGLTHKSVLISWGAFFFRVKQTEDSFKLVDDSALSRVFPPRRQTIGESSEPYANQGLATVEVSDGLGKELVASASTSTANHCWVPGLQPDTEYTYRVIVNGEEWGAGERRDWVANEDHQGLKRVGRRYDNRFRTHPDPTKPSGPVSFAVIGDFGTGIKKPSSKTRRQREVATALERAVANTKPAVRLILTVGDNIYAKTFLGLPVSSQGDEDDDWYFTYYQPYRYIINRVPVYPCIGNHDTSESEERDDRAQLFDNLYLRERLAGEEANGRASLNPGLFYRFRYGSEIEFLCIDTSKEPEFEGRLFEVPKHLEFLRTALPPITADPTGPKWRIPFSHHPPFCAGPRHHNTKSMEQLLPLFHRAGVRAVFSGHEHNFQHSNVDGIDYFVTGGGGKLRTDKPDEFAEAHTQSWCAACHFLLGTIEGNSMTVRAIAEQEGPDKDLSDLARLSPSGSNIKSPMLITFS